MYLKLLWLFKPVSIINIMNEPISFDFEQKQREKEKNIQLKRIADNLEKISNKKENFKKMI